MFDKNIRISTETTSKDFTNDSVFHLIYETICNDLTFNMVKRKGIVFLRTKGVGRVVSHNSIENSKRLTITIYHESYQH